jgi:hypothetical protein
MCDTTWIELSESFCQLARESSTKVAHSAPPTKKCQRAGRYWSDTLLDLHDKIRGLGDSRPYLLEYYTCTFKLQDKAIERRIMGDLNLG